VEEVIPDFERFTLVNRAIEKITSQFYSLMALDYMTSAVAVIDSSGNRADGYTGVGTWDSSTSTLTFTELNRPFTSSDEGKMVMFSMGDNTYYGTVLTVVSSTAIRIIGTNLPSTDGTFQSFLMTATPAAFDTISLSNIPIMRLGQQVRLILESDAIPTRICKPVSIEALNNFDESAPYNKKMIVYAYAGEELLLRKGAGLNSYGTLTLRFPRIPQKLSSDSDMVDVPDGAIQLVLVYLEKLLRGRLRQPSSPSTENELQAAIENLYQSYGITATLEEIKAKVEALS